MDEMRELVFTVYLGLAAWQDQKKRIIPVKLLIWFGALGILLDLAIVLELVSARAEVTLGSAALGMLPGLFCLLLSKGTCGALGAGDGCFFLCAAFYLPWKQVWILLLGGLLCCSVGSLYVLGKGIVRGRTVRGESLPFLPFLLPVWFWMLL